MKYFLIFIASIFGIAEATAQQASDQDFPAQLRRIIASAVTNFSSLKSGQPIETKTGIQFQSKLDSKDTQLSFIAISNKGESDSYVISINPSLAKAESLRLNTFWDNELKTALGPTAVRDCHVVDIDDSMSADQCDFEVFKKGYSGVVSLIEKPVYG